MTESFWCMPGDKPGPDPVIPTEPPTLWDSKHINRLWIIPIAEHPGWNYVHGVFEGTIDSEVSDELVVWFKDRGRTILFTELVLYEGESNTYVCMDHACDDTAAMEIRMRWNYDVIEAEAQIPPFDGYQLA